MNVKDGDVFRHSLDGMDFVVKKIVNNMAVLESQNGVKQILTEVNTLKLPSLYSKKECNLSKFPKQKDEESSLKNYSRED